VFWYLQIWRGGPEVASDWPVSQVLMLWGALDWCSNCLFINWLMVRAPNEPRFAWRYWAGVRTHTYRGLSCLVLSFYLHFHFNDWFTKTNSWKWGVENAHRGKKINNGLVAYIQYLIYCRNRYNPWSIDKKNERTMKTALVSKTITLRKNDWRKTILHIGKKKAKCLKGFDVLGVMTTPCFIGEFKQMTMRKYLVLLDTEEWLLVSGIAAARVGAEADCPGWCAWGMGRNGGCFSSQPPYNLTCGQLFRAWDAADTQRQNKCSVELQVVNYKYRASPSATAI
jgi:hypothetical protein